MPQTEPVQRPSPTQNSNVPHVTAQLCAPWPVHISLVQRVPGAAKTPPR